MHHLSHLRLWRQASATVALCGLFALPVCSGALAGSSEMTAIPGKQRGAPIGLRVIPGFGGRVASARYRWERERWSLLGWMPKILHRKTAPVPQQPTDGNILVSGSVQLNLGFANRMGSHVDIVVRDQKGRIVERIAARYLPDDMTIRPRDPIGRRAYFAETLATPPRMIRNIGVQYHHGSDVPGESHL